MPALLEMMVSPFTPLSRIASISAAGMPHRPNPPDMIVMSSRNSPAKRGLRIGIDLVDRHLRPSCARTVPLGAAREARA